MSESTVGSVSVDVVPSTRGFGRRLRSDLDPEAAKIGQEFGQLFGRAAQSRMADGVKDGLSQGSRGAASEGLSTGRRYGEGVRRGVAAATKNPVNVAITADLKAAEARLKEFRALAERKVQIDADIGRLQAKLESIKGRNLKIDADTRDAELKLERLRLDRALATRDEDKLTVDLDIQKVEAKLAQLRAAKVTIAADTGSTEAKLTQLNEHLDRATRNRTVTVDANIAEAQAEVDRLKNERVKITAKVDADTAGASAQLALLQGGGIGAKSSILGIVAAVALLGPALIPIGAAAVGAFGAIATGAVAAVAGIGVLALALGPVIGVLSALKSAHDQSGAAARQSASSQSQVASAIDAVAGAQRGLASATEDAKSAQLRSTQQVADAARTLAEAEHQSSLEQVAATRRVADAKRDLAVAVEQAADDEIAANRRVEDAMVALGDAETQAALDQARANRRVADARRNLANVNRQAAQSLITADRRVLDADRAVADAQRNATKAQRELADARKQAARDAEDLSSRVANGMLDERSATLAVQEAQQRLAEVRADPSSSQLEVQRAQLAVDQALQGYQDQQTELQRLQQDKADAEKKGVEGSQRVQDAIDQERQAQQRLADAERDAADAAQQAAQARRDAAEQRSQAERDLSDAMDQAAAQQQDSAERIARANRDLADAVDQAGRQQEESARRVSDAQRAVADAAATNSERQRKSAAAVADAHRGVADAARASADQQRHSAEAIASAQQAVVTAQRAVQQASQSAGAAGGTAMEKYKQKFEELSPAGQAFVTFLDEQFIPKIKDLSKAAQQKFLPGLQDGLEALSPLMPIFTDIVENLAGALGGLARDAGQALNSPFWRSFFTYVSTTAGPVLTAFGHIIGNMATGFAGLLMALDPVLQAMINGVLGLSQSFANFGTGAGSDAKFQAFLDYLMVTGPLVVQTIGDVVRAVGSILIALAPVGPVVLGVVDAIAKFIASLDPAVLRAIVLGIAAIALGIQAIGPLTGVITGVGAAIGALSGPVGIAVAAIAGLAALLVLAYTNSENFRTALGNFGTAVKDAFQTIWTDAQPALQALWSTINNDLAPALGDFYGAMLPIWGFIVNQLAPVIGHLVRGELTTLKGIIQDISGVIRVLTGLLTLDMSTAMSGLETIFQGAATTILGFVQTTLTPLATVLQHIPGPASDIAAAIFNMDTTFGTAKTNIDNASVSTGQYGAATDDASAKADKMTEAQNKLADASEKVANQVLSGRDAENAYEQSIDDAKTALDSNGKTLDVHTEKGRRNREAIDNIADAANKYTQRLVDNGAQHDIVKGKMEEARQKLIQQAEQFGLTKEQAKQYADKVLAIPKEAKTEIKTPGATTAKTNVEAMKKATDDLGDSSSKTGGIFSRMWQTIRDAAKAPIRFVVDTIINRGIIDTFNKVAGYFNVHPIDGVSLPKGFATGGFVSGPGGPRDDKIPALLSNGEFVINAAATARHLELLKAINSGRAIGGDPGGTSIGRFANGGLIERIGKAKQWLPSVDPLPYVWGAVGPNSYDCSGLVGEAWARVTGHPSFRRYFTTSYGDFRGMGFQPGPGMFSMGVIPGVHMAGNLAGLPFEAASTASGIHVGSSAKPVSSFPRVWHLASLPGGSDTPGGISLGDPIGSLRHLFAGALDRVHEITGNPFGNLVAAVPHKIADSAVGFVHDAVPGFADGGLVHKYDQGGFLPPGLTTVLNATGKPEPVLTRGQFDNLRSAADGSGEFSGQLVLDSGQFLGVVRGLMNRGQSTTQQMRRNAVLGAIPR